MTSGFVCTFMSEAILPDCQLNKANYIYDGKVYALSPLTYAPDVEVKHLIKQEFV